MNNQQTIKNIEIQIKQLEKNTSTNKRLKLIEELCSSGKKGEQSLLNYLIDRRIINEKKILLIDGLIFEKLYKTKNQDIITKLKQYFSKGIIKLNNNLTLNYQPLQDLLINQNFQEADKLTQEYLCTLAGLNTNIESTRKWLYFTDIDMIPSEDLLHIDLLWQIYSRGKFGFSIQRKIWMKNSCKWKIFWHNIGWIKNDIPCRYPKEFIWTIDAPQGHLPLFNQLRGKQVLCAIFNHIVWQQTYKL
uniref:GUN4-like domain-containing protein n=1 Tax=Ceramothamnion japonicum TaxID=218448 RepID=A0A1C9CDD5_CERJP|nr:hypothetical protein Ceram_120 [Ceramium japonicum]AOM66396.1 hypothetical protein Ceram_120 [Ceramium japonicum]